MNIVFTVDFSYVPFLRNAVRGVIGNVRCSDSLRFYVIVDSDCTSDGKIFGELARLKSDFDIEILLYEDEFYDGCVLGQSWWSRANLFRLKLPSMLESCDYALYLDSDILIRKPIDGIFEYHIGDAFAGVVEAPGRPDKAVRDEVGLPLDAAFFNAGVMLLNLKRMRSEGIEEKCREFVAMRGMPRGMDQSMLNLFFENQVVYMNPAYNVTHFFFDDENVIKKKSPYLVEDFVEARNDPVIYHFIGPQKPWVTDAQPFAREYQKKYNARPLESV